MTAAFIAADGQRIEHALTFTPEAPGLMMPHTVVIADDPSRRAPGYTLLPLRGDDTPRLVIAYDAQGRPRWVHRTNGKAFAAVWHPTGNLTALNGTSIIEIDPMANLVKSWSPEGEDGTIAVLGYQDFHHEAYIREDGSVWTLSKVSVPVNDYPVSETDPYTLGPATLADDRVSLISADGTVIHQIDLTDVLPTSRIGFNGGDEIPEGIDWTHSNAIWPVPEDDAVLVSSRHQDTVVKIDLNTGQPVWILANHEGWPASHTPYLLDPQGADFGWNFHQHAPMADGDRVLMFDNGNAQRLTPYSSGGGQGNYSRIVEFTVDEAAMTVEQTFSWGEDLPTPMYSQALGNADYLDNGNIFATFAYLRNEEGIRNLDAGWGDKSMHLIEIDRDTGEVVWDLLLHALITETPDGWYGDRATRVASLYPAGTTEVVLERR